MSNEEMNQLLIAEAKTLAAAPKTNTTAALQRFRQQRNTPSPVVIPIKRRWPIVTALTATAATVLIALTLLWLLHPKQYNDTSINSIVLTTSNPRTQTLPDGSSLQLSAEAKITYPKNFTSDRHILLSGDAFFTVAHDAANPFRVEVNNLTITVLGTAFGITTLENKTEIVVKEGLIEVARQQLRVKVAAHQKLTIPHDTGVWQTVPDTLGAPIALPSPATARTTTMPPTATTLASPATAAPQKAASRRSPDDAQPTPAKTDTSKPFDEKVAGCETMRAILDDIVKAGLAPNRDAISFTALAPDGLIVNGARQPDSLYKKFREKYLDASGNGYYYGSLPGVTGRGYFFGKTDLDNCQSPARRVKSEPRGKAAPPKAKMQAI